MHTDFHTIQNAGGCENRRHQTHARTNSLPSKHRLSSLQLRAPVCHAKKGGDDKEVDLADRLLDYVQAGYVPLLHTFSPQTFSKIFHTKSSLVSIHLPAYVCTNAQA